MLVLDRWCLWWVVEVDADRLTITEPNNALHNLPSNTRDGLRRNCLSPFPLLLKPPETQVCRLGSFDDLLERVERAVVSAVSQSECSSGRTTSTTSTTASAAANQHFIELTRLGKYTRSLGLCYICPHSACTTGQSQSKQFLSLLENARGTGMKHKTGINNTPVDLAEGDRASYLESPECPSPSMPRLCIRATPATTMLHCRT